MTLEQQQRPAGHSAEKSRRSVHLLSSIYKTAPIRHSAHLALRDLEADFGPERADTFLRDLHPDLRAIGRGRSLSHSINPVAAIPR